MSDILKSVKGELKLISKKGSLKNLNADIYKTGNFVVKVRSGYKLESAKAYHAYQIAIRKDLEFLPEYFGTIIGLIENDKEFYPSIISFFEWVEPLAFRSLKDFRDAYDLILKAYQKGYFLDPRPPNFGKKSENIIYLDDGGVGKLPYNLLLPEDSIKTFTKYFKKTKRLKDGHI